MTSHGFPATEASVRRSVLLLSLACFCSMATQRICDAMLPELSREFGTPLARTSQVVSVFAVVYALAQLVYGSLGDRHGKFRVLTYTTLASGLACLLASLAASLDWLVIARGVIAMFAAAIIPLSMAWTGDAVDYDRRQETLARLGLGTTMGIVGGQLLGGLFADTLGWRWAFVLMALLFVGVGGLLRADFSRNGALTARQANPSSAFGQTRGILRDTWVRTMLGVSVVHGAAGFGVVATVASHLHEAHGLKLSTAGGIVALFGLGGVVYMTVARHLIRRLGEYGLARWGGWGLAIALATVGLSPWWMLTPVAMLIGGFAFFMLHNTLQAHATQMTPQARGLGVSLFSSGLFVGQALGVLVATQLIALMGSGRVIALGALVIGTMGSWLAVRLKRRHQAADTA